MSGILQDLLLFSCLAAFVTGVAIAAAALLIWARTCDRHHRPGVTVARALTARGIKPARDHTLRSYQSARAEFRECYSFDERTPRCGGALSP